MPEIILVRQEQTEIKEADREAVRRVIFGILDGLGEKNRRMWRRFWWNIQNRLEAGEIVTVTTHKSRSTPFHRRHFALEQAVFESQERFEDFDQMICWVKVGAGHVDWLPGAKGAVMPIPRSISYAAMEDGEFREFHTNVIVFLRQPYCQKVLWPHLDDLKRTEMMECILGGFNE